MSKLFRKMTIVTAAMVTLSSSMPVTAQTIQGEENKEVIRTVSAAQERTTGPAASVTPGGNSESAAAYPQLEASTSGSKVILFAEDSNGLASLTVNGTEYINGIDVKTYSGTIEVGYSTACRIVVTNSLGQTTEVTLMTQAENKAPSCYFNVERQDSSKAVIVVDHIVNCSITLIINDEEIELQEGQSFTRTLTELGRYRITYRAHLADGSTKEGEIYTINLSENTAPYLRLEQTINEKTGKDELFILCTDNRLVTYIEINGEKIEINEQTKTLVLPAQKGQTYEVKAYDEEGGCTVAAVFFENKEENKEEIEEDQKDEIDEDQKEDAQEEAPAQQTRPVLTLEIGSKGYMTCTAGAMKGIASVSVNGQEIYKLKEGVSAEYTYSTSFLTELGKSYEVVVADTAGQTTVKTLTTASEKDMPRYTVSTQDQGDAKLVTIASIEKCSIELYVNGELHARISEGQTFSGAFTQPGSYELSWRVLPTEAAALPYFTEMSKTSFTVAEPVKKPSASGSSSASRPSSSSASASQAQETQQPAKDQAAEEAATQDASQGAENQEASAEVKNESAFQVNVSPEGRVSVTTSAASKEAQSFKQSMGVNVVEKSANSQQDYTPVRFLQQVMDIDKVSWDAQTRSVTMQDGTHQLVLPVGADFVWVNGEKVKMSAPVELMNGRAMLPIQAIAQVFTWRNAAMTASQTGEIQFLADR